MQGFRASHVRWSVFRRRRGTSPSPTLGRRRCRRRRGWAPAVQGAALRPAGWGWVPAVQGSRPPRPVVGVSPAAGDKPQPYIRSAALPPAAGDERRRCRVPALPRPVVGVSPAGGWLCAAGRLGMSAGGAGFRPSHVRWSVFRRRRGTSPSPTLGRWRCRRPVGDERRRYRGRRCRRRYICSAAIVWKDGTASPCRGVRRRPAGPDRSGFTMEK